MFASEEEALAAAEALYGEYLAAENALATGGWANPEILESFVRGEALEDERESAERFRQAGLIQVGNASFDSIELQQVEQVGRDEVTVTVYLCIDVSGVDVVDGSGVSVVPDDRPDRSPLEVEMDNQDASLKVSRSEVWTGATFC